VLVLGRHTGETMMKVTIEMSIRPFPVPSHVGASTSMQADRQIGLEELSANDLENLCEQFTCAVFKKAGKQRPPQQEGA
jgi:hypothetical protein